MKKLIVIAGPTASGKTSLAVELAKQLDTAIISADSRQFYKELSIGTAKPTAEEMQGITHYFVDSHSVTEPLTAGQYEIQALAVVEELFKTKEEIIVVGGSGLFINALIYGTDQLPHEPAVREKWNQIHQEKGIEFLQEHLREVDLEFYNKVDTKNAVRLIRAIEIFEITGIPYSQQREMADDTYRFETEYFVIDHPREILYDRINRRVDIMVENGLFQEVENNIQYKELQSLNTVGYKEVFSLLAGEIDKERAIELIKQNSRRYAKRQLTWFRREKNAHWISYDSNENMVSEIMAIVHK